MDGAWLHDLSPYLIRFIGIRWYGVSYLAGFIVGWIIFAWLARRRLTPVRPERVDTFIMAVILGVILGGRLGYVFFYRIELLWTFLDGFPWWGVLAINEGGMSSHGGIIGVIVACLWFARREKVPFLHIADIAAALAPLGLCFGRCANFINGELLGRVVAQPGEPGPRWSVRFPQELLERATETQQDQVEAIAAQFGGPVTFADAAPWIVEEVQAGNSAVADAVRPILHARMPSQLIQAFAEGLVILIVVWVLWAKPRRPGVIGGAFLLTYGLGRIVTEVWRLPDQHLVVARPLGLSRGQWLSVAMVVAGVGLLAWCRVGSKQEPIGGWRTPQAEAAT